MASYAAHIIDHTAVALGIPSITVMAREDDDSGEEFVADYDLPDDADPFDVLREHGWASPRDIAQVETGYQVCTIDPGDWITIAEEVTLARDQAKEELKRQESARNLVIRDAALAGASPTRLAKVTGRSRTRIYQIKKRTR